jgi:hypothetical protein
MIQLCEVFLSIRTRINKLSIFQLVLCQLKSDLGKYLSCKFSQTTSTVIDRRRNLEVWVYHIARGPFSARLFFGGQAIYLVGRYRTGWLSMDRLCVNLFSQSRS